MKALHVVASLNAETGGPAASVVRLADALAEAQVETTVAALDYARLGPRQAPGQARVACLPAGAVARALRGWSPALRRLVEELAAQGMDVVHGHGLWMFPNVYARRAALRQGRPLVISPRGMLSPWSLARSRARKALAWRLFERDNLAAASLLHATSEAEAGAIRAAGCTQPVAVIPNGVDLPDLQRIPGRECLEAEFAPLRDRRWLLFLSRLHPVKGIDGLLRAWRALAPGHAGWQLVLAGPDGGGHGAALRRLAAELGLAERVTFTGMLAGERKACALGRAQALVLPSHTENFGIVVAEALAHGTPALATHGAPWAQLREARCGWWIEDREDALAAALEEVLGTGDDELRAMGMRGRALVAQRYAWAPIGRDMKAAYAWLLGSGPRPESVR